mmetsp:Transcript_115287/g.325792  ORF Transcript_115287/g.325792 Transcript_115287/m.325792 type:complete len:212 (-) Transcript_115287:100-735(-)
MVGRHPSRCVAADTELLPHLQGAEAEAPYARAGGPDEEVVAAERHTPDPVVANSCWANQRPAFPPVCRDLLVVAHPLRPELLRTLPQLRGKRRVVRKAVALGFLRRPAVTARATSASSAHRSAAYPRRPPGPSGAQPPGGSAPHERRNCHAGVVAEGSGDRPSYCARRLRGAQPPWTVERADRPSARRAQAVGPCGCIESHSRPWRLKRGH